MQQPISTFIILLLLLFSFPYIWAQNVKFGKVSKEELQEKIYPMDSSANAAILYKKRRTYYDYTTQNGWTLITKVHERLKVYNKEGYDWATKRISLYKGRNGRESVSIKANTYDLVNGKVSKIKLKSSEVFDEEVSEYWGRKKFTMPNLKEGSVVEWEYTIRSPYYSNIDDMVFQYAIPVKYIDTEIRIPEYFVFKYLPSNYYPVRVNETSRTRKLSFVYRENSRNSAFSGQPSRTTRNTSVDLQEKVYSSIEQNIPAIREEPFVNNINNYKSKTSFELTAYRPANGVPETFNSSWEDVTKTIYKSSNFGEQLKKTNHFEEDLAGLVANTAPLNEKVGKIFQFVKSKIKWNDIYGKYTRGGVKKAYKEGVGNVAEINLTLVAMLRKAGINANPVLVSTRDHGIPIFPTSEGFNYVIAAVEIENNVILLDATEAYSLPNVLPLRVLNWQGRIVRKSGSSVDVNLFPLKASAEKVFLNVKLDEDALIGGMARTSYSNLIALNYRKRYNNLSEDALISKLEKENDDIEIVNLKLSNKQEIGKPVLATMEFESDNQAEVIGGKIYFSPLFYLAEKENPFKLEERLFPIDFGSSWEDRYTITIKLPEGYTVESQPENVAYSLPDGMGSFKFVCLLKDRQLQVLAITKINRPILGPNYYTALKEFYKKMIDKQLEKVVLSKI